MSILTIISHLMRDLPMITSVRVPQRSEGVSRTD